MRRGQHAQQSGDQERSGAESAQQPRRHPGSAKDEEGDREVAHARLEGTEVQRVLHVLADA